MFLVLPLQHKGTCRHGDKKASLKSWLLARTVWKSAILIYRCHRLGGFYHANKEEFSGTVEIVSYLEIKGGNTIHMKDTTMKLTTIALASAFALSGTVAFAHTVHHKSAARTYREAAPMVQLHPNYGNPNGNADGPTTLSGTGDSSFGGSSPGTSGYN
jgi:hypothetical protein